MIATPQGFELLRAVLNGAISSLPIANPLLSVLWLRERSVVTSGTGDVSGQRPHRLKFADKVDEQSQPNGQLPEA